MSGVCWDRVVVTGAGQCLGRAHALALAAEKARVAVDGPGRTAAKAATDGTALANLATVSEGAGT